MRSVIHPDYTNLSNEFAEIIRGNYTPTKTFCNTRNTVELVNIAGKPVVVKRYKKANIITGLIYTLFRKSKARRAYEYALRLLALEIDTPAPIAYFELRKCGIFRYGYFISEYVDMPTLQEKFYGPEVHTEEHQRIANELSHFTLSLHQKGIIPLDYNTSNILYKIVDGKYRFTLIDINRMKFAATPGIKDSMRSFFQLGTYPQDYVSMLSYYVNQRGFDFEDALYHVIRYRRHQTKLRKLKKFFKKFQR